MYSRFRSLKLGRRPGKRPSARAFAWPATERSLIEFRDNSLKASTIASWSLPVDVEVSKSSARDRNSTPAWCRTSITCSPQVSPVSGGAKWTVWPEDRGHLAVESCQPAPVVTPEQGGLRTSFWSAPERSVCMTHLG